jgi:hypothetical protein
MLKLDTPGRSRCANTGLIQEMTTIIQTPGYSATEKWVMVCQGGMLTLYDPRNLNPNGLIAMDRDAERR